MKRLLLLSDRPTPHIPPRAHRLEMPLLTRKTTLRFAFLQHSMQLVSSLGSHARLGRWWHSIALVCFASFFVVGHPVPKSSTFTGKEVTDGSGAKVMVNADEFKRLLTVSGLESRATGILASPPIVSPNRMDRTDLESPSTSPTSQQPLESEASSSSSG